MQIGKALSGPMLLESIDVTHCNFGNYGTIALLAVLMEYCPCLTTLELSGNVSG